MARRIARVADVVTQALGSELLTAPVTDDTVLNVENATDFAEDGGTLIVAETYVHLYTEANHEAGSITLAAPFVLDPASPLDVGDLVLVYDTDAEETLTEKSALLVTEGETDDGDALRADLEAGVSTFLREGLREPGDGELVEYEKHGSRFVVVNVIREKPVVEVKYVEGGSTSRGGTTLALTPFPGRYYLPTLTEVGTGQCWPTAGEMYFLRFEFEEPVSIRRVYLSSSGQSGSVQTRMQIAAYSDVNQAPAQKLAQSVNLVTGSPASGFTSFDFGDSVLLPKRFWLVYRGFTEGGTSYGQQLFGRWRGIKPVGSSVSPWGASILNLGASTFTGLIATWQSHNHDAPEDVSGLSFRFNDYLTSTDRNSTPAIWVRAE